MTNSFVEKLTKEIGKNNSLLCLGLDPEKSKIPSRVLGDSDIERMKNWCLDVIGKTTNMICCIKPNIAFFEQYGVEGIQALKEIRESIPEDMPVLLDAKRGDIGSTADAYAKAVFEYWSADAVTVSPLLGKDSIAPFLKYPGKMVFILCKTSNPSASEIQDHGEPKLYEHIAKSAAGWGSEDQIGFVVGATQVESLATVREIVPNNWILAPGIGAQGGDLKAALEAGLSGNQGKLIVPVSRGILYAEDPRAAAIALKDQINQIKTEVLGGKEKSISKTSTRKKKELIKELFEAKCIKFGQFTLASGKTSPIYVDLRRMISYPELFSKCIQEYVELSRNLRFDCVAAVPYAALPAASGVAQRLMAPMIYPRKEAKTHGTGQMIEGAFAQGETALLIEDVITTGGSIITALQTLKEGGMVVKDVIVLVDRQQGGDEVMAAEKVNLHSVMTIKEVVEILHEEGKLENDLYQEVRSYLG